MARQLNAEVRRAWVIPRVGVQRVCVRVDGEDDARARGHSSSAEAARAAEEIDNAQAASLLSGLPVPGGGRGAERGKQRNLSHAACCVAARAQRSAVSAGDGDNGAASAFERAELRDAVPR